METDCWIFSSKEKNSSMRYMGSHEQLGLRDVILNTQSIMAVASIEATELFQTFRAAERDYISFKYTKNMHKLRSAYMMFKKKYMNSIKWMYEWQKWEKKRQWLLETLIHATMQWCHATPQKSRLLIPSHRGSHWAGNGSRRGSGLWEPVSM